MFKKLTHHLGLALVFFVLTLAQQYLFYWVKDIHIVWLTFGKYFGVFAILLAATFISNKFLRYLFLSFVMILNAFQMGHLSYYGTQLLPNEIYLLLTQFNEVQGTLLVELHHVFIPLLFTIVPCLLGWFAFKNSKELYKVKYLGLIFCLYFIYNPIRTFVTGNTWGRQPSTRELAGMNVYLAFSYFSGKILPHKLMGNNQLDAKSVSLDLKLQNERQAKWDKVIFILGESLTPNHMELFGYERSTTPFLKSISQDPNFFYSRALSSGVSTDIAVAFLLNMGFGPAGSIKAAKGEHCLFKLAKKQKYTTHFLSIQSAEQLRYIAPYLCAASLDEYKTLEDISPQTVNHQAALDRDLLPSLKAMLDKPEKQFIMLHQRGSHAPWELRFSPESNVFKGSNKVDHYDNSVVEFDTFMKEFHSIVKNSKQSVLVVYVSDHGEALGEGGNWGHGALIPASWEVPFLAMSFNAELPAEMKTVQKNVTHYNLSLLLSKELGYAINQDAIKPVENYVIFGNDIDGFAGQVEVQFKDDGLYDFKVKL
ncbi:phosphoethanolamine transferase [Peredibacter starrii]|uniref:Sulfatase-like hydrolase/transferase n=1 Tax=Peredibacter starrii TaxID=28202 RepID=A0AAX4HR86_9BACT|nr:sulfatase-like hydrolase/transferase [Peredibacter starrii]WPU65804.1 sulfatase-like hydrolase/transferase [Peredibacter starrii]